MLSMALLRKVNKLHENCAGAAAVEMALIAASIFILAPFLFDLSLVVSNFMSLDGSLRAGVQLALVQPSNTNGIAQTIQTASGFPANSVTVQTTQFCECSAVSATCGTACADGSNPYKYITITASYSVPTTLSYPGYPANKFPISRATTVRIQ